MEQKGKRLFLMDNPKQIGVYGKTIASSVLIAGRLEAKYNAKGYATKQKNIGAGISHIVLENLTTIETIEIEAINTIKDNYFDIIYTNIDNEEEEIYNQLIRIGKKVTNVIEI